MRRTTCTFPMFLAVYALLLYTAFGVRSPLQIF
jgi:hypothetical protein